MEAKWEEWGKKVGEQYKNGAMPNVVSQQNLFEQMPVSDLTDLTQAFTKKMLPKLNVLLKKLASTGIC